MEGDAGGDDDRSASYVSQSAAIRAELLQKGSADLVAPDPPSISNIKTSIRVRPPLPSEVARYGNAIPGMGAASFAQYEYEACLVDHQQREIVVLSEERMIGQPTGALAVQRFRADEVFGGGDCNDGGGDDAVFVGAVLPLVSSVLRTETSSGHRAAMLAFGQTGAGKTHTCVAMELRAASELLSSPNVESIGISFLELCGEKLVDLLNVANVRGGDDVSDSDPVASLALREDATGELAVVGLSERWAASIEDAHAILTAANATRAAAPTASNERSSRSHAVCTLRPVFRASASGGAASKETNERGGRLVIVDLAGSERREDVGRHDKERMEETRATNTSLSALKDCVRLQRQRDAAGTCRPSGAAAGVVPYRRSKLTRLLRPYLELGGDVGASSMASRHSHSCVLIAHLSPLRSAGKHTGSTLEFVGSLCGVNRQALEKAAFNRVEQWTPAQVMAWVGELDEGRFARFAVCFSGFTGKLLSVEWLGHLVKRIRAEGGEESDAHRIYEAFHEEYQAAKLEAIRIAEPSQSAGDKPSKRAGGLAAARKAAMRKGKSGSEGNGMEVTIFEGPSAAVVAQAAPRAAGVQQHGKQEEQPR